MLQNVPSINVIMFQVLGFGFRWGWLSENVPKSTLDVITDDDEIDFEVATGLVPDPTLTCHKE